MEREFLPAAEAGTSLLPTIFKEVQTEIRVRVNTHMNVRQPYQCREYWQLYNKNQTEHLYQFTVLRRLYTRISQFWSL